MAKRGRGDDALWEDPTNQTGEVIRDKGAKTHRVEWFDESGSYQSEVYAGSTLLALDRVENLRKAGLRAVMREL